ncbi:MAG: formylglycine-generating enzyme family protein, partial [Nostocales cyanobacterium]
MDILTYIQNRHFTYKVDEGTIFVSGLCFEELDDICSTKEFYGIDFYEPYDLREPGEPFDSGVQILLTADHPMYNYKSIDQQIDPATEKQPNEYDAVLSEQTSPLASAAVLGGIEGIKLRLENPDVTMKIAALYECSQYGEEGFDLLIQYLNNEYWQVQKAAYLILNSSLDYLIFNSSSKQKIKEILQQTNQQGFKIEQIKEVTVNEYGRTIYTGSQIVKYFIEDLGKGVTLEMAVIPGGTFMMGSPEYEQGRSSNENPQHLVTVPDFLIGKYPITQAQYKAIIGRRVSKFKGNDRPVDNVSWCDALEFCQVLSQITGKNYKLPSEAQWEYACRAGTGTPFYFGKTITTNLVNFYGEADYPYA